MKKLIVLSGAGISAESGLKTFRDSDGLWEGYNVTEVATPGGWRKDPELVLDFYNMRRKMYAMPFPMLPTLDWLNWKNILIFRSSRRI